MLLIMDLGRMSKNRPLGENPALQGASKVAALGLAPYRSNHPAGLRG
jgi:hypothetical protein